MLALLHQAAGPVGMPDDVPGAVRVMRSERRLQALDFWLRNPDYLADELLNEVVAGRLDRSHVEVAESLLTDLEPSWRHFPMPKWLFGAYEALDDAFALLETYGLAVMRRDRGGQRHQFFLLPAGASAADQLADDPVLGWYPRQVALVLLVARDEVGAALKRRQYLQAEYAGTELGCRIGPISERVRERLAAMRGES